MEYFNLICKHSWCSIDKNYDYEDMLLLTHDDIFYLVKMIKIEREIRSFTAMVVNKDYAKRWFKRNGYLTSVM
jgi:hypothetical protein